MWQKTGGCVLVAESRGGERSFSDQHSVTVLPEGYFSADFWSYLAAVCWMNLCMRVCLCAWVAPHFYSAYKFLCVINYSGEEFLAPWGPMDFLFSPLFCSMLAGLCHWHRTHRSSRVATWAKQRGTGQPVAAIPEVWSSDKGNVVPCRRVCTYEEQEARGGCLPAEVRGSGSAGVQTPSLFSPGVLASRLIWRGGRQPKAKTPPQQQHKSSR